MRTTDLSLTLSNCQFKQNTSCEIVLEILLWKSEHHLTLIKALLYGLSWKKWKSEHHLTLNDKGFFCYGLSEWNGKVNAVKLWYLWYGLSWVKWKSEHHLTLIKAVWFVLKEMEKWTPLNSDIYGMVYVVKYAPCFQFSLSYYTISCLQHAYKGLNNDSKVSLLHNSFLLFQLLQNHLKCVRYYTKYICDFVCWCSLVCPCTILIIWATLGHVKAQRNAIVILYYAID